MIMPERMHFSAFDNFNCGKMILFSGTIQGNYIFLNITYHMASEIKLLHENAAMIEELGGLRYVTKS